MPAEWERHDATWLAWPHNPEDWPGKFHAIPWLYAEIVRLLSQRERVEILVNDEKARLHATGILKRAGANFENVRLSPVADQSRMDSRFWADFRA